MSSFRNSSLQAHICAMPDELLVAFLQCIESERDILHWMSSCRRLYGIGRERLELLNAANSASALRWAIVNKDMRLFQRMMQLGAPLDMVFSHESCKRTSNSDDRITDRVEAATPLIVAIAYGRTHIVERLLRAGADVNLAPPLDLANMKNFGPCSSARDWKPILWAVNVATGSAIIKLLLDYGANVFVETTWYQNQHSPLSLALCNKRVTRKCTRKLLASRPPVTSPIVDQDYSEALISFFERHRTEPPRYFMNLTCTEDRAKLRLLLHRCAKFEGRIPLTDSLRSMVARFVPNAHLLECVRICLDIMAEHWHTDAINFTLTSVIVSAVQALKLIAAGAHGEMSFDEARDYSEALFTMLLDGHVVEDLDSPYSPLIELCRSIKLWEGSDLGAHFMRFFLLKARFNAIYTIAPTEENEPYRWFAESTPLHWAAYNGLADAASLIFELCDVDYRCINHPEEDFGYTPLMHVCKGESKYRRPTDRARFAELLLKHGADVLVEDEYAMTAIDYARKSGFLDLVRILEGSAALTKDAV